MGKQSYPVEELVSKVKHGEIRLPEMQRSYVWTASRVRDLLDSLYRGYPSGTILTWETENDVVTRDFAIGQGKTTTESFQLLLDGQQRLTSLSAVLRGEPLYVKGRKRPIDILFNLEHPEDMQVATEVNEEVYDDDEDPETAEASKEDLLKRAEKMAFAVKTGPLAQRPHWVSVTDVLRSSSDSPFLKQCGLKDIEDPRYNKYTDRLGKLRDIKKYEYDVYVLEKKKSYTEVTDIFVRVNSLGAKLRGSDLALAQITAKWPNSLKIFEAFQEECKDNGFSYDLGTFIKNLVAFITGQSQFKIVPRISKEQLEEGWENSKNGFRHALNFLKSNVGIDSPSLLSTPFLVITLGYFLTHEHNSPLSPEKERELRYWLLVANAKGRYSRGSTETYLDQDLGTIRKEQGLSVMVNHLRTQFGRLDIQPDDLAGRNSRSAYFKTMFLVFKKDEAKDWRSGLGISLNHSGTEHKLQFHHIFPQALLKRVPLQTNQINDIANLSFISGKTNQKISATPPIEYFPKVLDNRGRDALAKQCIPIHKDLWKLEHYEQFLEKRRSLIADRMNEFIGDDPFKGKDTA